MPRVGAPATLDDRRRTGGLSGQGHGQPLAHNEMTASWKPSRQRRAWARPAARRSCYGRGHLSPHVIGPRNAPSWTRSRCGDYLTRAVVSRSAHSRDDRAFPPPRAMRASKPVWSSNEGAGAVKCFVAGRFGGFRPVYGRGDGRVGVGLRVGDHPWPAGWCCEGAGALVVWWPCSPCSGSVPEGRAEARLPVIHSPARGWGMVIYGRDRMGSIRAATAPSAGEGVRPANDLASGHVEPAHATALAGARARMCPSRRP